MIWVAIFAIVATVAIAAVHQYHAMTWTGGLVIAPQTARNGATTTFMYKVTGRSDKTGKINGVGRPVQFILAVPGPNEGVIESYTDANGTSAAVNRLSINAVTDNNGSVSVAVKIDSQVGRGFTLTAIDTGRGCNGTACAEYAAFTVVPP